ncbi:MAG: histidine kinase dimerization/phosphoacceptor domain-containing protein [Micromonosporaceae bacterium]
MAVDLTRQAPAGAVAFSAVIPVMEVILIGHRVGVPALLWAAGITACYLPGFLRLVHHAAQGTRMRYAGWALLVVAAAAAVSQPLTGAWFAVVALGAAALLALRMPWSLLVAGAGIAAQTTWVLAYGAGPGPAVWRAFSLVWEVAAVYSVVWLVGVTRRLRVARAALADSAVARDRVRTERELRHSLGGALDAIATEADRAAAQLRDAPALAPDTIALLVRDARATLADARRIISQLSRASVRAELDTARSLLAAAGIGTTVTAAAAGVDADDEQARSSLRTAVAELLAQPLRHGTVVTISRRDGQLVLTAARPGEPS